MPNFERFRRTLVPLKSQPALTIHRRGLLSLNRSAFQALDSPGAVELLYDRDASIVGLRSVDVSAADAVYVRPATRSTSGPWVVSAMAFVKYYDIDVRTTRRWPCYLDDGVLCIDLAGPSEIVTGNRARSGDAPPPQVT